MQVGALASQFWRRNATQKWSKPADQALSAHNLPGDRHLSERNRLKFQGACLIEHIYTRNGYGA